MRGVDSQASTIPEQRWGQRREGVFSLTSATAEGYLACRVPHIHTDVGQRLLHTSGREIGIRSQSESMWPANRQYLEMVRRLVLVARCASVVSKGSLRMAV